MIKSLLLLWLRLCCAVFLPPPEWFKGCPKIEKQSIIYWREVIHWVGSTRGVQWLGWAAEHDNAKIVSMNSSTKKQNSTLGNFRWWERGIIYQVYPRSFMDGKRRRDRRSGWYPAKTRLSRVAWRRRDLDFADLSFADGRLWLRCQQLHVELRRSEPALSVGDYAAMPSGEDLMAYMRKAGERRLLIVLNFGAAARRFNLSELQAELHCCFQPISIALRKNWTRSFSCAAMRE